MKRSKIFNWLYFIILLIPIMFVFLPMINNETIYKTEVKQNVEVVEYGTKEFNILPFLKNISYQNLDNEIYYVSFNDLFPYLNYYGYVADEESFSLVCYDTFTDIVYRFGGDFVKRIYGNNIYYGILNGGSLETDSEGFFNLINDDDDDIYEGFSFDITVLDSESSFRFIIDTFNYLFTWKPYLFYYKDYVITEEIVKTSIWYDFSVKINDSVPIMGNFTEWVNDNIVDFSSNDYVFFSWTYMIYIFIVSLLWLLIQFILFLVRFAERWLNGIYEKF